MNTEPQLLDYMKLAEISLESYDDYVRQSRHIKGKGSRLFIESLNRTHRALKWAQRGRFSHKVWLVSPLAAAVWNDPPSREAWMKTHVAAKRLLGL